MPLGKDDDDEGVGNDGDDEEERHHVAIHGLCVPEDSKTSVNTISGPRGLFYHMKLSDVTSRSTYSSQKATDAASFAIISVLNGSCTMLFAK